MLKRSFGKTLKIRAIREIRGKKTNYVYPVGSSCGFITWGLHGPHTCPAEIFTNGVLKNKQSKRNFGSE